MRKLAIGALMLVLLGACDSGGGDATTETTVPAMFTIVADVTLDGPENVRGQIAQCAGAGRFIDLYIGARVVVTDSHGVPRWGDLIRSSSGTNSFAGALDQCIFRIEIPNIPVSGSYSVILGRQAPQLVTDADVAWANGQASRTLAWKIATPPPVKPSGPPEDPED